LGDVLGKSPKFSSGNINSLYGIQDDPRLYQISNPVQPGNSGSPLFSEKGELVGIVVASINAKYLYEEADILPQNINFAIKSDYLINLLSMLPEGDKAIKRSTKLTGREIENQVKLLTPYILQIKAR
jgi:S1-C subfamily serine protease